MFVSNLFFAIITGTVKAVIASIPILIILRMKKKAVPPRIRVILSFIALLLFPAFTGVSMIPDISTSQEFEPKPVHAGNVPETSRRLPADVLPAVPEIEAAESQSSPVDRVMIYRIPPISLNAGEQIMTAVVLLWAAGIIFSITGMFIRRRRLHRRISGFQLLNEGSWQAAFETSWSRIGRGPAPILLDGREEGPFVARFRGKSVIVVPAAASELTTPEQNMVLLHECTHIIRRDLFLMTAAEMLRSLGWHIPFLGRFLKSIETGRELLCDEKTVSLGADPKNYATMLLELTRRKSCTAKVGLSGAGVLGITNIEGRIQMIIGNSKDQSRGAGIWAAAVITLAILAPSLNAGDLPGESADTLKISVFRAVNLTVNTCYPEMLGIRYDEEFPAPLPEVFDKQSLPLGSPVAGEGWRLTNGFGRQIHPMAGEPYFHKGIDIAGTLGSGVFATMDGTVIAAEEQFSFGRYILIKRGNIITAYTHLDTMLVEKGQKVRVGTEIGTCGRTGLATGPHLHYEVFMIREGIEQIDEYNKMDYPGGIWLDPLPMIAAALF